MVGAGIESDLRIGIPSGSPDRGQGVRVASRVEPRRRDDRGREIRPQRIGRLRLAAGAGRPEGVGRAFAALRAAGRDGPTTVGRVRVAQGPREPVGQGRQEVAPVDTVRVQSGRAADRTVGRRRRRRGRAETHFRADHHRSGPGATEAAGR